VTLVLLSAAFGGLVADVVSACLIKRWGAGSVLAITAALVLVVFKVAGGTS
jgi:hypothetical protein